MKDQSSRSYFLTVGFTLLALVFMVAFTFTSFYNNAVSNLESMEQSNLAQETERLNAYLSNGMNTMLVTSIAVEHLMQENASPDEIKRLLTRETNRYTESIDENFTGLYGLFHECYLDGSGWVPPADYQPRTRVWYTTALAAKGKPVLVAPYVDAQTGKVMISACKLLYDGESVIALDIALDGVQTLTAEMEFNGMGYGFVTDRSGLVIAHHDKSQTGLNYRQDNEMGHLLNEIFSVGKGSFRQKVSGEDCTVFVNQTLDDWYVAMIISNTRLFQEIRGVILRNTAVCLMVFLAITAFCTLSYRRVRRAAERERQSSETLRQMNNSFIDTLARTIDAKDRYTRGHSRRVAEYAREIARRMGKTSSELDEIYCAGLLHDLGKIRVPEEIINKPGRLTDEEFGFIKLHPVTGYHILRGVFSNSIIPQGAKFHHEQYGGLGYPNGLQGENIPEIARILGVADSYDAMASNRSYRKALPQAVVREEIEKGRGVQFDPKIANIMLDMIDEDTDYNMKEGDEMKKTILVVDDEPINIKMTTFIMKDEPNITVVSASSGPTALELLANTPVDLILLDVKMPGMDGFETLSRIRQTSKVPVVFMTADKNLNTLERSSELGVDDYLTKPVLPMALKEVVHSILQ